MRKLTVFTVLLSSVGVFAAAPATAQNAGGFATVNTPSENFTCNMGCGESVQKASLLNTKKLLKEHYVRGIEELENGNYYLAAVSFDKASRIAPKNAQISYVTGASYYLAGDYAKAAPLLRLAADADSAKLKPKYRQIALEMLREIPAGE